MWRTVCRRWKDVIDDCPSLWSAIVLGSGTKHVKPQLENSKGAPLHLEILSLGDVYQDDHLVQLLADSAYRWQSVLLFEYPLEIIRRLGSLPSTLDTLNIHVTHIPQDCRFFNLIRPNLRKLILVKSTIPYDFDPTLGLEELHFSDVREYREDGKRRHLSIRTFHHFLQANPNLQALELYGSVYSSPSNRDLQPINLPKLENVVMHVPKAFHLFRAEHCLAVRLHAGWLAEKPSPSAWTTPGHTLRRVERMMISVTYECLRVLAVTGPYNVEVTLDGMYGDSDHRCSVLQDFLNEAEKHSPISASVSLGLFTNQQTSRGSGIGLEILELLQTPVWDPCSGQTRWRIPNLEIICMLEPGLPYHHLRAFVHARSNGNCIQPASPITGIFILCREGGDDDGKDVLNEVMACTGGENDG
ncbi:hypothetical protein FS837_009162 [Tulasnella sp. UAMH 9824]|nr:hypothetical protein FS837_009162 [Tulasnella sp. UAMH 9824]